MSETQKLKSYQKPEFKITNPAVFLNPTIEETHEAPSYENFIHQHQQTLKRLEKLLKGIKPKSICIEGAHIYSDESITHQHLDQLAYLKHLKTWIESHNHQTDLILFVDDYHPTKDSHIFDLTTYEELASQFEIEFDAVISESELSQAAETLIDKLETDAIVKDTKNRIVLASRNYPVLITEHQEPSCGLLDAQLSLIKKGSYDLSINLLPAEYKKEQTNTRKILQGLGEDPQSFLFTFLTK